MQAKCHGFLQDALRWAARGIDARLKATTRGTTAAACDSCLCCPAWQADKMQTLCHGDPKGANIMWDDEAWPLSLQSIALAKGAAPFAGRSFFLRLPVVWQSSTHEGATPVKLHVRRSSF